eukprot:CAMPEP_0181039462 /NCGR_PEP_ID=MMETSP1070-20121207/10489_1 /TAXON_ID=265543 /ORGANISM="Minutocellus polymorphus, Strain NH13" /LENGTH=940 /DNA_ID=CAMNT_0023117329 /DNA_START=32 /DNA_END=2854 /DNA_ORIENTATION=+
MARYAAAAVLSVILTSSGHHQKNNEGVSPLLLPGCSAFVAPAPSTLPASIGRSRNARLSSASLLRMSTHPGERVTDGRIIDPSASSSSSSSNSSDRKSPPPLTLTSDPLSVLGLDTSPTSYPNGYIPSTALKRAYRQRTAQYHPDAILAPDSTKDERQKANDDFARITAAYEAAVSHQVQYQIRTDADITTTEVGGTTIGVGINVFAYDFDRKKEELEKSRAAAGGGASAQSGDAAHHWDSTRERLLNNQLEDMKNRLQEAERVKTEQHSSLLDLEEKIAALESEVSSQSRVREDADSRIGRATQRIGKAFGKIFSVLGDGASGEGVADDNSSSSSSTSDASASTTPPTADDIDEVVSRLVDDALPLLEKKAVSTATDLERQQEELDQVRDEVSTLQGTLHQLKQERHEAEANALATKERTKTLRSGFFAEINKEVAVATTQVERKAKEMEELNKKELRVKSQLDVLQKEIKEKKKEMNSLTFQAEDTMRAAKAEKAKAEKAVELADRTSEDIMKKESDLAIRLEHLEGSQARLEADRQSLKHDLMALQEQKKDLEDREADIKLNIENLKTERRDLEEAQLSTEQASDELELQRKEIRAVQDRLLLMQTNQEELEAALADKELELIESESDLLGRIAGLEKREKEADAADIELKEFELDLNHRNEAMKLQSEDIEDQRRALDQRSDEVAAMEAGASSDRSEVDRLTEIMKSREADINKQANELQEKIDDLKAREEKLKAETDDLAEKRKDVEREWVEIEQREKTLSDKKDLLEKKETEHKEAVERSKKENDEESKRLASFQDHLEEEEKDIKESRELLAALDVKVKGREEECNKREEKLSKEKQILEDSIRLHREKMLNAQGQLDDWKKRREEEEKLFIKIRTDREVEERRSQQVTADAKRAREDMLKTRVEKARKELGVLQSEVESKVNVPSGQANASS